MTLAPQHPIWASLNSPQREAVTHTEGPVLVFAGAGSGKTRVITYRIAHLIRIKQVLPYRILAVTFTNKAAGEMKERLTKLLSDEMVREIQVGTFHATCARLLRRYHADVGLTRDFVIYDDSDQKAIVARVLKELGYDDRSFAPKIMLGKILREKQEGRGPSVMDPSSFVEEVFAKTYETYEKYLKASNAVDFEDLLVHVMKIAENTTLTSGEELRRQFDYVLVDEFQDTNQIQYRLVRALVSNHHNLCVVGDDDQSIYRWRGGDVKIIRGFKRDFPEAKMIKLEENYRSSGNIVKAALAVIAPSKEREPKELFTSNGPGELIEYVIAAHEREEAAMVVAAIQKNIEQGVPPEQIAIFYRIHAMSRVMEEVCRSAGIAYRIVGGTRFFDRAEIKDMLAYMRVVLNPRSDVDLLRIINTPARGIGDTSIKKLIEWANQRSTSLFDALDSINESPIAGAARNRISQFRELMHHFRSLQVSPSKLAEIIFCESGLKESFEKEDSAESDARLENMKELIGSIKEFEMDCASSGIDISLASYLERVTLSASADDERGGESQISLMTVHGSKGLEFDTVFLLAMEEEIFPYIRKDSFLDMDIEEERRLAYVAMTRAKRKLFLLSARTRTLFGITRPGITSRFVHDIPDSCKKHRVSSSAPLKSDASYGNHNAYKFHQQRAPRSTSQLYAPGERYVERDTTVSAHIGEESQDLSLRRGTRVKHARFGEGTVLEVISGIDPGVTARFPGWGEKKILLRYLEVL